MFKLKKERINFKKKLGSGASGTVYPYQKDADDSKWVIKRMLADDSDKLLTYLPEIVLGFSCDHPCIVPLKGYSIEKMDQEGYYIYLKFPRMKETLKEKFDAQKKSNKPFSEEKLVKYFYSMVCAVDYLHKKKIYHRDIKPGNVLLDENGNLMLSDVGVAKHVGEEEIYQPLTGQGGTVDYTAPELLKDKSKLTKENLIAGDAWSLGLVMLELCILKNRLFNPYAAQEKIDEVQKNLHDQLKEIYSKTVLELIFKLLKPEPNERIKITDLKQTLEVEYKCCLNPELSHENEERKNNEDIEFLKDPLENNRKSDESTTQETMELVESLLRENSQLQNQLKEHKSFFNQFQSEMLPKDFENETIKKLRISYQETLKKLNEIDGIHESQKDKNFYSEIHLGKKEDEQGLEEKNEVSKTIEKTNVLDKEEKKESQESIPKIQEISSGVNIDKSEDILLKSQNEAIDLLKKGEIKIVIAGYSAGGKTSLSYRLKYHVFQSSYSITIGGQLYDLRTIRDGNSFRLKIWDTAGEEKFMSLLGMYFRGSSVVIVVYDICERYSFDQMPDVIKRAKEYTGDSLILFIVGNKLDLSSERKVLKEEAAEFARKHGGFHLEVSAKTGENFDEFREQLENAILKKYYSVVSSSSKLRRTLTLTQENKKSSSFWDFFG